MTAIERNIVDTLTSARIDQGMTQREVADRIYSNRVTVSSWERHERTPAIDTMACWSKALGLQLVVGLVPVEEES